MAKNLDDLIPSANEVMKKIALAEAEKAAESFRKHAQAEERRERNWRGSRDRQACRRRRRSNSPPRSSDARSIAAARKCWSIVFRTICAPIMDAPSTKGSQDGRRR